jgi:hypothetical protein
MSGRIVDVLKFMMLGAASFWFPDALWHAIRGSEFSGRDTIALTGLMPLTLLATYIFLKRQYQNELKRPIGWPLVLGVWLLGGPFMVIGASFAGGGFVGPDGLAGGIKMMLFALIPIFTIDMATYDGSLGALFVVSLAALLILIWAVAMAKRTRVFR